MGKLHAFPASTAVVFPDTSFSAAIQTRRDYLNREISSLCSRKRGIRLLCLGLSNVHDLECVLPAIEASGGEVIVLERDECRAEAVRQECSSDSLDVVPAQSWSIERSEFGRFDFIYAPSLLCCLSDPQAKRSLARLACVLRRGGRLFLSTASPEFADTTYEVGETQVRSEEQVGRLSDHITDACFAGQIVWRDPSGMLIFLEIHR